MRLRNLGPSVALVIAILPRPAEAQTDYIKDHVKNLIEKSGVYVSASTRTAIDDEVTMGPSIGVGFGMASSHQRTSKKFPFSFSSYSGGLRTDTGVDFGRIRARQIMSGIGYQWVHGKMVYGAQVGLGYSFNTVTLDSGAAVAFRETEPVSVSVSNSWVVRPQVKAEYFLHRKVSLRTQLSYTYTEPEVVVHTVTGDHAREWRPQHAQLSFAVGYFPFRK